MENERKPPSANFNFHTFSFFSLYCISSKKGSHLFKTNPHNSGTVVCCVEICRVVPNLLIYYLSGKTISLWLAEGYNQLIKIFLVNKKRNKQLCCKDLHYSWKMKFFQIYLTQRHMFFARISKYHSSKRQKN